MNQFYQPEPSQRSARRAARPSHELVLETLPETLAICRLNGDARVPRWATRGPFTSISRSDQELSVVCADAAVPAEVSCQRGFRAFRVAGALDFSLIGVLKSLVEPLSKASVGVFAISTYDTDYLVVRESQLADARRALEASGHRFRDAVEATVEPPADEAAEETDEGVNEDAAGDQTSRRRPRRRRRRRSRRRSEEPIETADAESALPSEAPGAVDPETDERATRVEVATADEEVADEPRAESDDEEGAAAEGLYTGAIPQHPVEITDRSFAELGLSDEIQRTVSKLGFEHPTPIQAEVIPPALEGRDIVGLAETGSGKTAAFVLPIAERLFHGRGIRGLILCPTREIALQTKAFLDIFGRYHALETVVLIGGVKLGPQIDALRRQPDIIVATPGRLADHLRRRNVRLDRLEELVLDEADHMLDLGFLPQIKEILDHCPEKRRTMMFSATMPPAIARLAHFFLDDPVRVDIRPDGQAASGIEHRLYLVGDDDRKRCLVALLKEVSGSTLIFARRKLDTEWLSRQLEIDGFEVERIHSNRSQGHRVRALRGFREGQHRILVATDVAARGLDIPRIEHVVNFGLPEHVEDYVHRAGRTARGNAAGIVSSIGTWKDRIAIQDIEHALGHKLERCEVEGVDAWKELPKRKTVRRRRLL